MWNWWWNKTFTGLVKKRKNEKPLCIFYWIVFPWLVSLPQCGCLCVSVFVYVYFGDKVLKLCGLVWLSLLGQRQREGQWLFLWEWRYKPNCLKKIDLLLLNSYEIIIVIWVKPEANLCLVAENFKKRVEGRKRKHKEILPGKFRYPMQALWKDEKTQGLMLSANYHGNAMWFGANHLNFLAFVYNSSKMKENQALKSLRTS